MPGPSARRRSPCVSRSLQNSRYQRSPARTQLRHLELAEAHRLGDRRQHLPRGRGRSERACADDAALGRRADADPGGDQGVERAVVGRRGRPRGRARPGRATRSRSSVSYQRGSASRTGPACLVHVGQVRRRGEPDPLHEPVVGVAGARVEQVPPAVVPDDAAGPGARVVPGAGAGPGRSASGSTVQLRQVGGDGVADASRSSAARRGRRSRAAPAGRTRGGRRRRRRARSPRPSGRRGAGPWRDGPYRPVAGRPATRRADVRLNRPARATVPACGLPHPLRRSDGRPDPPSSRSPRPIGPAPARHARRRRRSGRRGGSGRRPVARVRQPGGTRTRRVQPAPRVRADEPRLRRPRLGCAHRPEPGQPLGSVPGRDHPAVGVRQRDRRDHPVHGPARRRRRRSCRWW